MCLLNKEPFVIEPPPTIDPSRIIGNYAEKYVNITYNPTWRLSSLKLRSRHSRKLFVLQYTERKEKKRREVYKNIDPELAMLWCLIHKSKEPKISLGLCKDCKGEVNPCDHYGAFLETGDCPDCQNEGFCSSCYTCENTGKRWASPEYLIFLALGTNHLIEELYVLSDLWQEENKKIGKWLAFFLNRTLSQNEYLEMLEDLREFVTF